MSKVVGVDVGGANLKYASDRGSSWSRSFALWRTPDRLGEALAEDLLRFGAVDRLAVTMTGELADCFVDRANGVARITNAVLAAANRCDIGDVRFYGVDGRFHTAAEAVESVDLIAAANWHALANYVAADLADDALLVDIGSTTTDLIPIANGQVATAARTDYDRLSEGSLVYIGCRRTPVCALIRQLRFGGRDVPVMNEVFSTTDDVRLLMGTQPPDTSDCDTADGRPRTPEDAAGRLARMIGLDRRAVSVAEARELAEQVTVEIRGRIGSAMRGLGGGVRSQVVLSGHGQDLIELPESCRRINLATHLGSELSRCGPAYAIAWLSAGRGESPSTDVTVPAR